MSHQHGLHAVADELAGSEAVLHAGLDGVGDLIQIHVAGDDLAVGAHHTDEGAVQLFRGVAQGVKQASVGRALRAFCHIVTSHFILLIQKSTGISSFSAKTDALGFNLSVCFADKAGLRHPASAALCLRIAGRGPNNGSLFPPLAAVAIVAPTEGSLWRRDEALRYAKASPR